MMADKIENQASGLSGTATQAATSLLQE